MVFTGSLRFNLDPFDEYNDEELWKTLDVTHLKTYVSDLEGGLQHEVSEGGSNLRFVSHNNIRVACLRLNCPTPILDFTNHLH